MGECKISSFKEIVPMIYAYTTPDYKPHKDCTKIGYTERQTPEDRIGEQSRTIDIKTKLLWALRAAYLDRDGGFFTDKDFHRYLEEVHHIKRLNKTEWFRIGDDGKKSKELFYEFAERKWRHKDLDLQESYVLRQEQEDAVTKTLEYFQKADKEGLPTEFLWNAKPRFGKTLAAYDLVRKLKAKSVLIVTNRPSIANSWWQDYLKFIAGATNYQFVSDTDSLKDPRIMSREQYTAHTMNQPEGEEDGMIAFESLQGLKGSVYFGGQHDKLQWLSKLEFDLLIIDEAHEGVDTYKTDKAFDNLHRKYTLHLSGTPFKAIANSKFTSEQIFNWTYVDEQKRKAEMLSRLEYSDYENLPTMNMFTYQLSPMVEEKVRQGIVIDEDYMPYAFELNEFFRVNDNGHFVYEKEVKRFLDCLTLNDKYPFSTESLRNELRHTFWLLNRVNSAKALAKLLKEHSVFKNYKVVVAAGDGTVEGELEEDSVKKSYDAVRAAIKENDRTITLSVGQLTTGVTIPEWSAVLMLSDCKSPELYMQAAFRTQTPYRYEENNRVYSKENAYVFDFAPERTLTIIDVFANSLLEQGDHSLDHRKNNIREFLNFFPVIGEDKEGTMRELDPEDVMTIPQYIKAKDVIHRGFMSNFLFQNVERIFANSSVLEIVLSEAPSEKDVPKYDKKRELHLDSNGEVNIPQEEVVQKRKELFGDPHYQKIPPVEIPEQDNEKQAKKEPIPVKKVVAAVSDTAKDVVKPLVEEMSESYGMSSRQVKKLEKQIVEEIESKASKITDKANDEIKVLNTVTNKKLEEAVSEAEIRDIKEQRQTQVTAIQEKLKSDIEKLLDESEQVAIQDKLVEECERSKSEKLRNDAIDVLRGKLRVFTRTIPSFIMAYGDRDLCLQNFDDYTPDDVFYEVTGITEDDFRLLRDGGDYTHQDGRKEHVEGHLFDEVVFNEAIKQFLDLKEKLSNYFDEGQTEDIFDYIPPQKNTQIFTPKRVVKKIVDMLEAESPNLFADSGKTFIDPYMKSGLFIVEVVKRLYSNEAIKKVYPDKHDRIKHILEKQVFGVAPTQIIYDIATNYIFGFDPNSTISRKNFIMRALDEEVMTANLDELAKSLESEFDR